MGFWDLRALTGPEIATLESDGQGCRVGLAILPIRVVFSAEVASVPAGGSDRIAEVEYDTPVGDYVDVLPGMSIFVGSSVGDYSKGICRVRKDPTSSVLYIGEASDVEWAVDDVLTVVEDFGIWPRHQRVVTDDGDFEVFMDWDVPYSDQYDDPGPVPVLGPDMVVKLTGATVVVTDFDSSDSWVLGGASILGYLWEAPGASGTAGMTSASPSITYDSTGWFRITCTVTADNGKSTTSHRWVYIYSDDDPPTWIAFQSCGGDWGQGGWSFRIAGHYDVDLASVRNRAFTILFAEDTYDGSEESVGLLPGRENLLAVGWIAGETIVVDPDHGYVEFDVQGPHFWLGREVGFPCGIECRGDTGPATSWMEYTNLTVRDALWAFLYWRTTVFSRIDVPILDNDTPIGLANVGQSTLWAQLSEISERSIKARPMCDRFGRLVVQVDSQFLPLADRSGIPTIQTISKGHWRKGETIQFERRIVQQTGRVDLSGVAWDAASLEGTPYFSLAPGHVMHRFGEPQPEDHLAVESQGQANQLAGLILGWVNNPYPSIMVPLAMNSRVWDICPLQYGEIDVVAADTPRGVSLSGLKIIPRRVSFIYSHGERGNHLLVDVDFEGATDEATSVDGDPPPTPPAPGPMPGPPPSPPPPPAPPVIGDPAPDVVMMVLVNYPARDQRILVRTTDFQSADPTWAITLADLDSPDHYHHDFSARVGYSITGWEGGAFLHRILDLDTATPEKETIPLDAEHGVGWSLGGYRGMNGLACATDDPALLGLCVGPSLAAHTLFHQSEDFGESWEQSDFFPNETCYYCNEHSGPLAVCAKPASTGVWYVIAHCGWYGPSYVYEMIGIDIFGSAREEIYLGSPDFGQILASGQDGYDSAWLECEIGDYNLYKNQVNGPIHVGPFDAPITIPYNSATPGIVYGGQLKVYRAGWDLMGTPALINAPSFLAPCSLDASLRWAVGARNSVLEFLHPLVKYTDDGGADDLDWVDKTGNLHALLTALGWDSYSVEVRCIIPVLGDILL